MKLRDLLLVFINGEVVVNYNLDEVYFGSSREAFDCKDSDWFLDNEVTEIVSDGEAGLIIYTR